MSIVRFIGGPKNNEIQAIQDDPHIISVLQYLPRDIDDLNENYSHKPHYRAGEYVKTYFKQKNGTIKYQWIGWKDGRQSNNSH